MTKYYKFTTAEQIAQTLERLIPGKIEAIRGAMDIHGGGATRVWVSEFDIGQFTNNHDNNNTDALIAAIKYISRNISGPKKFSIEGIYLDIESGTVSQQYQTADQMGTAAKAKNVIDTLSTFDDYYWEEAVDLFSKIPKELLTPQVVGKILTNKYNSGEYPRNIVALFPITSFTSKIKKLLLTKDPDTIFYFPDGAGMPQDVLFAIDQALKTGGFASSPADSLEELPGNLPEGSVNAEVINALKTKIGVPDAAFTDEYLSSEQLERIKSLAGIDK